MSPVEEADLALQLAGDRGFVVWVRGDGQPRATGCASGLDALHILALAGAIRVGAEFLSDTLVENIALKEGLEPAHVREALEAATSLMRETLTERTAVCQVRPSRSGSGGAS